MMEFPGRLIESEQFGAIWIPTATVEIKYQKFSLSCEMLVDTGGGLRSKLLSEANIFKHDSLSSRHRTWTNGF